MERLLTCSADPRKEEMARVTPMAAVINWPPPGTNGGGAGCSSSNFNSSSNFEKFIKKIVTQ